MIFLKPNQISGEIMTLFDEADEKVIIVSPYCKIGNWIKLAKKFKALQERGIPIDFYVRANEPETFDEVSALGIEPMEVPNLHAKLYMNEKQAIVSSMNLHHYSEINSIDIGYKTTTEQEYQELWEFYERHIQGYLKEAPDVDWKQEIVALLETQLKRVRLYAEDNSIVVNTKSSRYHFFIACIKGNYLLRLNGILSGTEFEYATKNRDEIVKNCGLAVELTEGKKGYYDCIWGTQIEYKLASQTLINLKPADRKVVISSIVPFVLEVERIKETAWQLKKKGV